MELLHKHAIIGITKYTYKLNINRKSRQNSLHTCFILVRLNILLEVIQLTYANINFQICYLNLIVNISLWNSFSKCYFFSTKFVRSLSKCFNVSQASLYTCSVLWHPWTPGASIRAVNHSPLTII